MLNSTVLEVAIGLSFAYAAIALITSSIYEAIASLFKLRARSLLTGIQEMLNDPNLNDLALAVYNNALVNPRGPGSPNTGAKKVAIGQLPSYIEPANFAAALIQGVRQLKAGVKEVDAAGQELKSGAQSLQEAIAKIDDPQLKQLFDQLWQRANGNIELLTLQLSDWFDTGMARVSGAYKRDAQIFSFLIAFGIAVLLNVDSCHLFAALWQHPSLTEQLKVPGQDSKQILAAINTLPIGWVSIPESFRWTSLPGWIITASSALFGSPFWFDALQRLTNLRGTGPKPTDERPVIATQAIVRPISSAAE